MDKDKLNELQKIVDEGTPYGEVLAVWTDGVNNLQVLTDKLNIRASGYIAKKIGTLFDMSEESQGAMNLTLKFKEDFLKGSVGKYYVEKSTTK